MNPRVPALAIDIRVGTPIRAWHRQLQERLEAAGHVASLTEGSVSAHASWAMVLALEARLYGANSALFALTPTKVSGVETKAAADLVICLDGGPPPAVTSLVARFDGDAGEAALIRALLARRAPALGVTQEDRVKGSTLIIAGQPAVEDPASLARALDHVLARTIVLLVQAVRCMRNGTACSDPVPASNVPSSVPPLLPLPLPGVSAISFFARTLAGKIGRRLRRGRGDHWHAAWRRLERRPLGSTQPSDAPSLSKQRVGASEGLGEKGVADTLEWPDAAYSTLPDDGSVYYADPFPFEHEGRTYIFCEAFPYATGKGIIVVFEIEADGSVSSPRCVMEQDVHLSYPQVFARDGSIFMLPEMGAAGRIELFRAERFPDRWVSHAVLVDDIVAGDATFVDFNGSCWLFATVAGDGGSSWDQLAIYHAPRLEGPWQPHGANPVLIDAGSARPAGAMWVADDVLWRVAQDCRAGYGAGLTLCRVDVLDQDRYAQTVMRRLGPPHGLGAEGVHTLNRSVGIEVIDWRAPFKSRI